MMIVHAIAEELTRTEQMFAIEVVQTAAQLREVYQIRHQVYCLERGYEASADGQEIDEFDMRSRHVLLRHASDGEVVGTVRIIASDPSDMANSLPMQRLCDATLLRHLPLQATGEISRFAISKQRRLSCANAAMLRLALMRGILQLSSEIELSHWCAVMERSLLRLLRFSAIHFHSAGPLVSYHGIRQPAFANIAAVLARIKHEQFSVWNFLTAAGAFYGDQDYALAA